MKKKILFLSGSRADYDLILPIHKFINSKKKFQSKLLISGSNLDKKYSNHKKKISNSLEVKINLKFSNKKNFSKILSNYFYKFYKLLYEQKPDLIVILGDRYEALIFAICAKFLNYRIIHIHGGETTMGSLDNVWRDIITKISDYHFVSHKQYASKVIKISAKSKTVFNLGAIGSFNLKNYKNPKIYVNTKYKKKILVSYHSSTMSISKSRKDFLELLKALSCFREYLILFTYPGHDLDSDFIINNLKKFNKINSNAILLKKAEKFNYKDLLLSFDVLVGNSSSGIIEAPCAKIPTINIGDRQKGRIAGPSVYNVKGDSKKIYHTINKVINKKKINFKNPYYKKNILNRMYSIISRICNNKL